jgi:hypothetical protein
MVKSQINDSSNSVSNKEEKRALLEQNKIFK